LFVAPVLFAAVLAVVLATAPVAAALSADVAVVTDWLFCACSAAIKLCIKADIACEGSCVDDVPLDAVLVAEPAAALVPLVDELVPSLPMSWVSVCKIEPNNPLPADDEPLV
jgi:hypothetical protein